MQFHCRRRLTRRVIFLLLARQSPVIRPACRPRMTFASGDLLIVESKLSFVRALKDAHETSTHSTHPSTCASLASSLRCVLLVGHKSAQHAITVTARYA